MKNIISIILIVFITHNIKAGEGMWLPLLLQSLNEAEMQHMGMKLSAEDIYSVNQGSLKDAIVHFGGFCTSELISPNGLLLTNHHCGYGQIQSHSSVEKNYLKDGFWAKDRRDELPNPGLTATFINEIIDVSKQVLKGVKENMTVSERQSIIDRNINSVKNDIDIESYQSVFIRPFFKGNQYFAFISTTYRDVRLVGAPPESVGKFGADTDNWVWPRHTGDFSLFRIYAGPDNLPADYSDDNIPYQPKHYLPISLDGVEDGDFTMVFGFPGRTNEYLPSPAIEQIVNTLNPAKIAIREKALGIIDKYMRTDEAIRIQYASKFARVANYWKKWIGERQGLLQTKAIEKKKAYEDKFLDLQNASSPYKDILSEFDELYSEIEPYAYVRDYYSEVTGRNIELMRVVNIARRLVGAYEENGEEGYSDYKDRVMSFLEGFYKDYRPNIDREVFVALIKMYKENVDKEYFPEMESKIKRGGIPGRGLEQSIFGRTMFKDQAKVMELLTLPAADAVAQIKEDEAYKFGMKWKDIFDEKVAAPMNKIQFKIDSLQRIYMKAQMEVFNDKVFYPDANSTMRVTYGNVKSYSPKDAVTYNSVTYLEGVMEKYKPGDYEFDVNERLLDLFEDKDYGPYADKNGKIPVCFIGSNHTTGGNSGSPAIDAHGNLIGLNFDRAWEGTMSDYNYDSSICRNIMVDVRYILFIVDKYAGASHLIEEMTLVHPKR